jgi:hypothetical protein
MRTSVGLLRRIARARLARRVARRLRRAGLAEVGYDARAFQVRFTAGGDDLPTILELAPLLVGRGRRHRRRQVDRFVAGLLPPGGLPGTWREVRPLLRPVLRGGTPGSSLRRPVLPFLAEFVVVDQPETMTYVAPEQPAGWGVSADEVFAAARANLSGAVLQGVAAEPVVVRFVDDGDAYWTSHLLLQHWLERLAGQVGGVPVAFAPERGTLLVTADGSDHLRGLFAQAEEIYATSSRPISPMAYANDKNGCPVPYAAPPGHPLHRAVQRAERVLAVEEYARQAARLAEAPPATVRAKGRRADAHNARDAHHRAATVAELRLVGSDEAGWRTRAIWERDEPVLLPRADEIQIGDAVRPWAELAARLIPAEGLDPTRWASSHWPQPGKPR